MKFVLVPAGEFLMGSDESPEVLSKAYPQYERHRVLEIGDEAFEHRVLEIGDEAPEHRVRITQAFDLASLK
jgi:hypothetical protein